MTDLTTTTQRLMLHAHFEKVCEFPISRNAILHLCELLLAHDPEFFSENAAFAYCYEDEYVAYNDFDLAVQMLREIYAQGLFVDNVPGFYAALGKFGVPHISADRHWGDCISELLCALESYVHFQVTMTAFTCDSNALVMEVL
jgi:hypothetical protein